MKQTKYLGIKFIVAPITEDMASPAGVAKIKDQIDSDGPAIIRQMGLVGDKLVIEVVYPTDDREVAIAINSREDHLPHSQSTYYGDLSLHIGYDLFHSEGYQKTLSSEFRSLSSYFDSEFLSEWKRSQYEAFLARHA